MNIMHVLTRVRVVVGLRFIHRTDGSNYISCALELLGLNHSPVHVLGLDSHGFCAHFIIIIEKGGLPFHCRCGLFDDDASELFVSLSLYTVFMFLLIAYCAVSYLGAVPRGVVQDLTPSLILHQQDGSRLPHQRVLSKYFIAPH
jgi:hypothetical protein